MDITDFKENSKTAFTVYEEFRGMTPHKVYYGLVVNKEAALISFENDDGLNDCIWVGNCYTPTYKTEVLRRIPHEQVIKKVTKLPSQFESQIAGNHYSKQGMQPMVYILANKLDFSSGNIVKYITRFRDKNGAEDLKKVIQYAQFLLEDEYNITSKIEYTE